MVDVRRAAERFTTHGDGITTRHSFSFGAHYDPSDVGYSLLVAHNDDRVGPGHGYASHPHRDVEIVTWVLEGGLEHEDTAGHTGVLRPGTVQVLGAGSGIRHAEHADPAAAGPTRFVQMWLQPDEPGLPPAFARADVEPGPGLLPLVSGVTGLEAPARLRSSGAALHLARLRPDESVSLPDAPRLHVFVTRGTVDLEGAGPLGQGDAARFSREGGPRLTARGAADVLVWQLP